MSLGFSATPPVMGHPRVTSCYFVIILMVSWSTSLSLLNARHDSMDSFLYVLVFATCFAAHHSCVTTTGAQTFASRQQCLEAAGRMVGIQSALCELRKVFIQ
jgi:hypothetical protein